MEVDSVIIRKSPVALLYKMILATVGIYLVFGLYSVFLYQDIAMPFREILTEKFFFFVVSIGAEAMTMIILFVEWTYCTYEIKAAELIARRGFFLRTQEIHSLRGVQSVYVKRGFFGTMFNYGSLQLHNPLSKEEVHIRNIPDPEKYATIIQNGLNSLQEKPETIIRK